MATIIHGGIDHFNELVYGQSNPATLNFIQQMNHNVSQTLTDMGRAFVTEVQQVYKAIDTSDITRRIKAAGRRISAAFADNQVKQLHVMEDFQTAPLVMRRWLMAEPTVRALYHSHGCDGYSGTYIDQAPGMIGEDHYDYRRVMDGVVRYGDEEDGVQNRIVYSNYHEETTHADVLLAEDRIDLITSWKRQRAFILDKKRDPTDEWDNDL